MDTSIITWVVILSSVVFARCYLKFGQSGSFPPGPQGRYLSWVKNQLPASEPWRTYAEWSKTFSSPIISFRVYNRTIVVLNDFKSIHALLDQRAHIYSDRPMSWMYNVICARGKSVFNISASDSRHRTYRRMLQSGLGPRATKQAWNVMHDETTILLHGFASDPAGWQQHIRRHAAGVIMKVAFGYTVESLDDPFIKVAEETSKISGWATAPGRWLVDYYAILRHIPSFFPGAEWKRQGLAWRKRLSFLSEVPHNWVKEQMKNGTHIESFTSRFLRPDPEDDEVTSHSRLRSTLVSGEEEDIIMWCAGGLYAGAADTTVSALISFVLLMALHPDVQRKAQAELDAVFAVNPRTLTSFNEYGDIPDPEKLVELEYLGAVMKEVLRYAPVGNLALPHCTTQEDEYRGYRIPKGATVFGNVWAVMHDPELYPEPFAFSPDRFLKCTKEDASDQPDPRQFAFGFGRRACPGIHFAETTMLLAMAGILGRFEIALPFCDIRVSNAGFQREETLEFTTGITSHIKPFPVQIKARGALSSITAEELSA